MAYRIVQTILWNDPWFRGLDEKTQLLWVYLVTHPQLNRIGAIPHYNIAMFAGHLQSRGTSWRQTTFKANLARICKDGRAAYDDTGPLLVLPNYLKHNSPTSPDQVTGWQKNFEHLPECPLRTQLANEVTLWLIGQGKGWEKRLGEWSTKRSHKQSRTPSTTPTTPPSPPPSPGGRGTPGSTEVRKYGSLEVRKSGSVAAKKPPPLLTVWCDKWTEQYGEAFIASGSKHGAKLKQLEKRLGRDELILRMDRCLACDDEFYVESRHSLDVFISQINQFGAAKATKPRLGKKAKAMAETDKSFMARHGGAGGRKR